VDEQLSAEVNRLSTLGNERLDEGAHDEAMQAFQAAWDLLPTPKEGLGEATWLLTAMGDVRFLQQRWDEALSLFGRAVHCAGGLGNPFIHLRLGQIQYELHDTDRARDELARAYMGGGDSIFEDEDPKYWRFIREIIRPPASGTGETS
jgi:tetratricopeptide (TPR) repeat protein